MADQRENTADTACENSTVNDFIKEDNALADAADALADAVREMRILDDLAGGLKARADMFAAELAYREARSAYSDELTRIRQQVETLRKAAKEVVEDCTIRAQFSKDKRTVPIGASAWIAITTALEATND